MPFPRPSLLAVLQMPAYAALLLAVMSTVGPLAVATLGGVLLAVLALWGVRAVGVVQRRRARAAALVGSGAEPVAEGGALHAAIVRFNPPLREALMRGHVTGTTALWLCDAWRLSLPHGGEATALELQTTPGYAGMGIPVWWQRHGALLLDFAAGTAPWPDPAACRAAFGPARSADVHIDRRGPHWLLVWRSQPPDGATMRAWLQAAQRLS